MALDYNNNNNNNDNNNNTFIRLVHTYADKVKKNNK